jgi:hypothetical protein
VKNLQQNADAFMIASQNELLTRTQRRAFELEDENKRLTAERDELARKLAVADKKNQHSLVNNICPDHRDKQQGKPCLACEIENAERIIKSIATMLGWLNVPPLRMIEGDISVLKERAHRADAAEAKVREVQAENERITHEAIRMAAREGGSEPSPCWPKCVELPDHK